MTLSQGSPLDMGLAAQAVGLANSDGEFLQQAAGWTGSLTLMSTTGGCRIAVDSGRMQPPIPIPASVPLEVGASANGDDITVAGSDDAWIRLLAESGEPGWADWFSASRLGRMTVSPAPSDAHLYNALRRFSWLLRSAATGTNPMPMPTSPVFRHGEHDHSIGRSVHVSIDGIDHRIHYESSGEGIPMLLHHTAGADSRQWRRFLEDGWIRDRFRVIAYDLPFHGRSDPPASTRWWETEYRLTTRSAMGVAVRLADALALRRPVFVGSSIGGMLALDLARYFPDEFRAVVALQGGLRSSGGLTPEGVARTERYRVDERLADPALPGARMMSAMSPTVSEAARHETMLHYTQGAPGVFAGDLYFHVVDHDLRTEAGQIDTSLCPVYLLTGEHDVTMVPISRHAAQEIDGSSLQIMEGLGHFPMSEDHDQLMRYLRPVLEQIVRIG